MIVNFRCLKTRVILVVNLMTFWFYENLIFKLFNKIVHQFKCASRWHNGKHSWLLHRRPRFKSWCCNNLVHKYSWIIPSFLDKTHPLFLGQSWEVCATPPLFPSFEKINDICSFLVKITLGRLTKTQNSGLKKHFYEHIYNFLIKLSSKLTHRHNILI